MAIVFIQSKKRQKVFLWSIITGLVLILFIIPLLIFYPLFVNESQNILEGGVLKPAININFSIIDSPQVKNLEPFLDIVTEFTYIAEDKNGKQVIGKISATGQDDAKILLQEMNLKILHLEESNTGRKEPFIPYYQSKK